MVNITVVSALAVKPWQMSPQEIPWIHCTLHWRHNDHDGVSHHQPHGCLLNRLFRRRSKKTSKFCVTGLCVGNSPGPVNSPYKGPATRKMFPFDDVIMCSITKCNDMQWHVMIICFDVQMILIILVAYNAIDSRYIAVRCNQMLRTFHQS